ncbi:MAG: divalent metal cation transporter [Chloroflexi bacterium]|nr:divalent metal cation transporter [Chloroflexota bacterium]
MPDTTLVSPPAAPTQAGQSMWRSPLRLVRALGPGLIAGASDNDPTTVATLSVVGATTAFGLLWLVVLLIPMLVVVQVISAQVGTVAREGLEDAVCIRFGRVWGWVAMLAVLAVSLVTLAADLEGGGAALGLLTGKPYQWFLAPFALAAAALLLWASYAAVQKVLRYVLLVFLAYIVAAFLARPDWGQVLRSTLIPHFELSQDYVAGALALLGTTLTSYAYVWETIETSTESAGQPLRLRRLGLAKADAGAGMIAAGILFWFILLCTGATLGAQGAQVQTAQDAAAALAPAAGQFASLLFGVGLLASAALAVPVLAGTCAYVVAELFGWRADLDASFQRARRFYVVLLACLAVGLIVAYLGISPIQLLFVSSIAGGLATPITLGLLLLVGRDPNLMRAHRVGGKLTVAGWLVFAAVTVAGAAYLAQSVLGSS